METMKEHYYVIRGEMREGKPHFVLVEHELTVDTERPLWDGDDWCSVEADDDAVDTALIEALSSRLGG